MSQELCTFSGMHPNLTLAQRLQPKIRFAPDGCWLWTAAVSAKGYGRIAMTSGSGYAHRVVFELLRGPIPADHDLDHLCRNRLCVNPLHLEPVPHGENVRRDARRAPEAWGNGNRRKTHCPQGHPYDASNTIVRTQNAGRSVHRRCRTCTRARDRLRKSTKENQ